MQPPVSGFVLLVYRASSTEKEEELRLWARAWTGAKELQDAFLAPCPSMDCLFPLTSSPGRLILTQEGANRKSSSLRGEKVDQGSKKNVYNSEILGANGTQVCPEANGLNLRSLPHQQRGDYILGEGSSVLMGFMLLRRLSLSWLLDLKQSAGWGHRHALLAMLVSDL